MPFYLEDHELRALGFIKLGDNELQISQFLLLKNNGYTMKSF